MKPDIRVFDDVEALSVAAAKAIVERSGRAEAEHGQFYVALSGGGTPSRLYHLLSQAPFREQVPWHSTQVFWGDERCVAPDDPESNYRQARDAFLSRVPVPQENVHRVRGELSPQEAAIEYASLLKRYAEPPSEWPRFDLVLLGMGEDGHTASLFPGSTVEVSKPTMAVRGDYQGRPAWRVTLTPPVLNAAAAVIFLVTGTAKASTLARVLQGEYSPQTLPSQRIRPSAGELIWLVDREAAAGLRAATT
jgi:6-phosphogluconolactonase